MTAHMSNTQMEKFCARVLPAPETVAFAEHLSNCASCQLLFHETFQRRRNNEPVTINLSPEFWFADDHLEYEQMVGLAESTLDDEELEMISIHLESCVRCNEDLRNFREFVRQIEPAIRSSHLTEKRKTFTWWKWPVIDFKFGYAAAVLIIIGLVTLIAIFGKRDGTGRRSIPDTASSPTNTVSPLPSAVTSASPQPADTIEQLGPSTGGAPHSLPDQGAAKDHQSRAGGSKTTSHRHAAMFSLNDSGRRILFDGAGRISGLDNLPPSVQKAVNETLLASD